MCLKLKLVHRRHTAKKDIVVFKGLSKAWYLNGLLCTPYMHTEVKVGETYESKLTKVVDDEHELYSVIKKGIHSFKNLKDIGKYDTYDVICECMIPKGAHYYKGKFGSCDSYASDKLTYVQLIGE